MLELFQGFMKDNQWLMVSYFIVLYNSVYYDYNENNFSDFHFDRFVRLGEIHLILFTIMCLIMTMSC